MGEDHKYLGTDLKNEVLGHGSELFGIMTTDELRRKYQAEPLEHLGEGCVIININRTYKRAKGLKSIYDATRESWIIAKSRIPNLKYVLSEYGGLIVEVFEVLPDGWYQVSDEKGKQRWAFKGVKVPDEIRNQYINRAIRKKRGAANPITYNLNAKE